MKTRLQNRLTRVDIAALSVFAAIWLYYIFAVRYGVCFPDEPFYVTIAERFARGGRPLVDEWHFSQFSCVFLCLPYRLFVAVKGGTDGIILFMRYLFTAFNAAFYWFMYTRLRAYRWSALLATVLFSAFIPAGLFACNYYTMAIRLLMIVCLALYAEKQTPVSLAAAGVVLACAVLYQPGLAFLYFGYSVLVWIRFFRRKKDKPFSDGCAFCLRVRTWKFLSLGVLVSAAAFSVWLLWKSGLRNILTVFPNLFTDPEFDFYEKGKTLGFVFRALENAADVYGLVCLLPALAVVVLSAVYACGLIRKRRETFRRLLFGVACALWIFSCVYPFFAQRGALSDSYFVLYSATLLWFGFVCFLLCEKKNKRLFFFWIVGLVSSWCIDVFSNTDLSLGCPIAYIADVVFCTELVRELCAGSGVKHNRKTSRRKGEKNKPAVRSARWAAGLFGGCFAVWSAFIVLSTNTTFPQHFLMDTPLFSFPYVCESGPAQGLHFPQANGEYYAKTTADLDAIRQKAPKNLYVCGMLPEAYLQADAPYSTYSSWAWRKTADLKRHVRYWTVFPEKKPECIFVPLYESNDPVGEVRLPDPRLREWIETAFDPLCSYTLTEGQSGYILYVSQWHIN